MIVYNHGRVWFAKKEEAEHWRRKTARPAPVIKVVVEHRDELVNLLNALCTLPAKGQPVPPPATDVLVDRAYIDPHKDVAESIPDFLKKDWSVS